MKIADKLPSPRKGFTVDRYSISRDSGIYSPVCAKSHGLKQCSSQFTLQTVRLAKMEKPIYYSDGTWLIDYSEHIKTQGNKYSQRYNALLMNA